MNGTQNVMKTFFLSDLHLTPERPQTIHAFLQFLSKRAGEAERIYLLGDLFEYWIGDDAAPLLGANELMAAMKQVSSRIECFFIAGNRDFLVGPQFSEQTGFTILPDETVIDLYGTPTLILHGDSLCTDDTAHMKFRQEMVTNTKWREEFLSNPIPQRIELAKMARMQSHQHKSEVSMEIMDVTEQAVIDAFENSAVTQMIHGHTHRQNTHYYSVNGATATRYVLGDWGTTDSILIASADGIEIENSPIEK